MEILGIGASELIFILMIAIIVLGPRDMQKAGRTIGRWLNQFVRSDSWKALQRASQEIKRLPTNLMREANLEMQDLQQMDREIRRSIDPRQPAPASRQSPPVERQPESPPDRPPDPNPPREQDD
jgi:sec-independent protein translocase protein TatB